jgi:hypothetical protein
MVSVNSDLTKGLVGIIYYKDEVIGKCDSAETLLDLQCQIKEQQIEGCRMEVEVEVAKNSHRIFIYKFSKDGVMIPSSYPGVTLWTDVLNKKLLYLYNFTANYSSKI